jgi:hypothetical protein
LKFPDQPEETGNCSGFIPHSVCLRPKSPAIAWAFWKISLQIGTGNFYSGTTKFIADIREFEWGDRETMKEA